MTSGQVFGAERLEIAATREPPSLDVAVPVVADVEGTFATGGSPLLQTVLTVAKALAGLGGGSLS